MKSFPLVTIPKPKSFPNWTPEQQEAYMAEERMGLHQTPCLKCTFRAGRFFRCPEHKNWGK